MTKEEKQNNEADYFARCLLMPKEMIKEQILNINASGEKYYKEELVKTLAQIFQVTQMQMTIRLTELKIFK